MADTVDSKVIWDGKRRKVLHLTNVCDGTGESAVIKADISTYTGPNGNAPTRVTIEEIVYSIAGFTSVRLFWDHTTDDEIAVLGTGFGVIPWTAAGGSVDPATAGGTGDILLTTAGNTAGSTYDISIAFRLKD